MPKGVYKHKPRSEEWKQNISKSLTGKKLPEEHKRNIGKASKKLWENPEYRKKNKTNKGKKYPEELYPNYGFRNKGTSWNSGLTKKTDDRVKRVSENSSKSREGSKRKPYSEETKTNMKGHTGVYKHKLFSDERKAKHKEIMNKPEVRARLSAAAIKLWQDTDYQKKIFKSKKLKPNNLEQFFNELTPDIIRYVGNGKFFITTEERTYNPDFKISGQNKLIELFGDYWHRGENPEKLIKEYKKVGWDCIIFWEHEILNNPKKVLDKTLKFIEMIDKLKNA